MEIFLIQYLLLGLIIFVFINYGKSDKDEPKFPIIAYILIIFIWPVVIVFAILTAKNKQS